MKSHKTYGDKKLQKIDVNAAFHQKHEEFIELVKNELPKIKEINAVVLFGSFARKDYSVRHSDIDLMIFLDKVEEDKTVEENIRKKIIQLCMGKGISAHTVFQYRKVQEEDKSLMLTIANEGKALFAKKSLVISGNILGLKTYYMIKFDTARLNPVVKNKLQRFLHGYIIKGKRYRGIVDEENVLSAGKGAIIVPEELLKKILLFAQGIGIKALQKGKFYR